MKTQFVLRYLLLNIGVFFCFICVLFTSCGKESHLEVTTDSVIIAKIYQLDTIAGKDAMIQSITPDSVFLNSNYLAALAWTNGGNFNTSRVLIEFALSDIPIQTQIDSARLSLFWVSHETLHGQTGENGFSILRIIQPWQENSVTWNNQPATSTENAIAIAKSISEEQSYLNIDVTTLVQNMINNPADNHGFMLKLNEEFPYKLVIVASSDYPDKSKHPKLVVYY